MSEKLTITDAVARCFAAVLKNGARTYDAANAKVAGSVLTKLFTGGEVDADTFNEVVARIGNHSAMRQWGVKMGFFPASDAAEDALAKAVKALMAAEDQKVAAMADLPTPAKPAKK